MDPPPRVQTKTLSSIRRSLRLDIQAGDLRVARFLLDVAPAGEESPQGLLRVVQGRGHRGRRGGVGLLDDVQDRGEPPMETREVFPRRGAPPAAEPSCA